MELGGVNRDFRGEIGKGWAFGPGTKIRRVTKYVSQPGSSRVWSKTSLSGPVRNGNIAKSKGYETLLKYLRAPITPHFLIIICLVWSPMSLKAKKKIGVHITNYQCHDVCPLKKKKHRLSKGHVSIHKITGSILKTVLISVRLHFQETDYFTEISGRPGLRDADYTSNLIARRLTDRLLTTLTDGRHSTAAGLITTYESNP